MGRGGAVGNKAKRREVTVDYEGMGTCIEAYIKVGGKTVCTIGASSPEANDLTDTVVRAAIAALRNPAPQSPGREEMSKPKLEPAVKVDWEKWNKRHPWPWWREVLYVISEFIWRTKL